MGTVQRRAVDTLSRFLKISLASPVDVNELLRIAIDEREPRTLDLDHDAVALFERMVHVREDKLHLSYLVGHQQWTNKSEEPPCTRLTFQGTSTISSRPNVKLGRLRPFMYLAAVCESDVISIGSAIVASQVT
jgi:hypothetical protein